MVPNIMKSYVNIVELHTDIGIAHWFLGYVGQWGSPRVAGIARVD